MRISVVLATHNGSARLPQQLRSLRAQTRPPDEVIASDDASSDGTVAILERFAATSPFPVRIERRPARVGAAQNFAAAIAAADGDVIVPCDQDDVWYPNKLARFETEFAADPALDLIFCDADVVDDSLRPLGYSLWDGVAFGPRVRARAGRRGLLELLVRYNVVTGAAMAFRAGRRGLILPIPEEWMHDGWIGLMLAAVGRAKWIDEPLLAYRQHAQQALGARQNSLREKIDIARRMDASYFDRLGEAFAACADRVRSSGLTVPRATIDLIRGKIEHCRVRRDMRLPGGSKRIALLRELIHGRYATASLGWHSAAHDLALTSGPLSMAMGYLFPPMSTGKWPPGNDA